MTDPELELCPWCAGERTLHGAGPGYVDWCCSVCARVSREEVVTDAR